MGDEVEGDLGKGGAHLSRVWDRSAMGGALQSDRRLGSILTPKKSEKNIDSNSLTETFLFCVARVRESQLTDPNRD